MKNDHSTADSQIKEIEKRLELLNYERVQLLAQLKDLRKSETNIVPLIGRKLNFQKPESPEAKIQLFKRLFCCREDIFPRFWENNKNNKKGYSPVCSNEWVRPICNKPKVKCTECNYQAFLPLDDIAIKNHLQGIHIAGTYAIRSNNTCIFLAADFDKESWKKDVTAYKYVARELGIETYIEISKSGNGAHAWIFFEEPVFARKARQLGTLILVKASALSKQIKLSSHDRFFPNQDSLPNGGFGNLIALPLQRHARNQGNTLFVDEDFTPIKDQWDLLSTARVLSQNEVDSIIEKNITKDLIFDGDNFDIKITERTLDAINKKVKLEEYSDAINIRLAEQAFINIEELPDPLIGALRRTATFANPEFYKKQRMRFSTWDTPRFICCSDNYGSEMSIPRGRLDDCIKIANDVGATVNIFDERAKHKRLKIKFTGELRPDQKKAMKEMSRFDTGVLVAPPGVGKTVMGCHLITKRKTPTLILVHRKPLMEQWIERIKEFLDIDPKEVGSFGGSRKKPKGKVDVAMIQTLSKLEDSDELLNSYGQIIVDECHHIPAVSFEAVLKKIPAKYFIGLTATPYRKDGHESIIHMQLGPTRYEMEDFGAKDLNKLIFVRETNLQFPIHLEKRLEIHEIWSEIVNNQERTIQITTDIEAELKQNRYPLIISERKDHISHLSHSLKSKKLKAKEFILVGEMGKKQKKEILDNIDNCIKDKSPFYILSTGSFIGEGFDLPILDTLFITMPISFKGRMIQYAGRIHRPFENKKEVRIYDYLDANNGLTINMFKKRVPVYKKMEYEIISDSSHKANHLIYQADMFSEMH